MLTFGSSKDFPEKPRAKKVQPKYGVFKKGDPSHTGFNKTFGGHGRSTEYAYAEEME